ncbi:hypothetical protein JCM19301_3244 [Jejuia pallidilutea]|uniref:Uncharacterized protein n=1 Tax=Jejuia pallidilutea TaxID=504487 RepID=A0A090W7U5_9FLAO|nr:hypothetical protein JCM19301_3244 [Jejuia pallidilutea]GAL72298.1 hypothetical protein JCM19302_43 [Jejuia pallidilutea]GAL89263.1 hypothetical protein JCM19538_3343 [Jejuia pallidilutea]
MWWVKACTNLAAEGAKSAVTSTIANILKAICFLTSCTIQQIF